MKKVLGSLLAATALLSLAACGGSSDDASSSDFSIKDRTSTQTGRHYLLGKMLPPHRSRKI